MKTIFLTILFLCSTIALKADVLFLDTFNNVSGSGNNINVGYNNSGRQSGPFASINYTYTGVAEVGDATAFPNKLIKGEGAFSPNHNFTDVGKIFTIEFDANWSAETSGWRSIAFCADNQGIGGNTSHGFGLMIWASGSYALWKNNAVLYSKLNALPVSSDMHFLIKVETDSFGGNDDVKVSFSVNGTPQQLGNSGELVYTSSIPVTNNYITVYNFQGFESIFDNFSVSGTYTFIPKIEFQDVSASVGISVLNDSSLTLNDNNLAWVDYNNDGWQDFQTGAELDGSRGVFLFKNINGTHFEQMSNVACNPMQYPGRYADIDNDGDEDWVTSWAGNHRAFNNNGDSFTWQPGPTNAYQAENSAFADFNNNGFLDFYRAGWESPSSFGYPDAIYTNDGNGNFQFSWQQTSLAEWFGVSTEKRWLASGRAATTADFDEDGDIDIYVSNYRLSPNFLQINDGSGSFTNLAREYGVEGTKSLCIGSGVTGVWYGHTIGSTFADMDNDGHLDLIVGNFRHNSSCGGNPNYQDFPMFYRNMGAVSNWHFEDKSATVNLPWVESHASPTTGDFDNDGDLDFFISAVAGSYSGQKCTLMRNDGNWNFTDISVESGMNITTPKSNFQAALADFDNDGDLDIFTGRKLFKNTSVNSNHWIKIKLVGDGININKNAIGAQARIQIGDEILTRQVESAVGWGNQNERTLHFGLGTNSEPVTIDIKWPDGTSLSQISYVDKKINIEYGMTKQEISLKGKGQNIQNNSTTSSSANGTDFGSAFIGDEIVTQTFLIENSGELNLGISETTFSGPTVFSIIENPNPIISAGGSSSFKVNFFPDEAVSYTGTINIINNDSTENPFTFIITGEGIPEPLIFFIFNLLVLLFYWHRK